MTSQSSGGSGSGLPGVTGDGLTPGGEVIAGALTAGDSAAVSVPTLHRIYGDLLLYDSPGNGVDGDNILDVGQSTGLAGNNPAAAAYFIRNGALNGHQYTAPAVVVNDTTATTAPVVQVVKGGTVVLELSTQKSITGALASVTDANAKAVLTSIVAALTGIKVATNNTT